MTESMRTRVALAIAAERGFKFIGRETSIDDLNRTFGPSIFREADAALKALREPTDAMIEAAILSPGDGNLGVDAKNTWQAMIDAALGERE